MLFNELGEVIEAGGDGKGEEEEAEYEAKIALRTISNANCTNASHSLTSSGKIHITVISP